MPLPPSMFFLSKSLNSRFPSEKILELIDTQATSMSDAIEKSAFTALTSPLKDTVVPYTKSKANGVPGAEKALKLFIEILRKWIGVERWFCDGPSYADSVDNVRKLHKDDAEGVLTICRAHEQLETTSYIVSRILSAVDDASRVDLSTANATPIGRRVSIVAGAESLSEALPAVSEVGMMGHNKSYSNVALRARKLLMQESMPSLEERKARVLAAARKLLESETDSTDELLADQTPVLDVIFPLLKKTTAGQEEVGLLELCVRKLYRTYTVKGTEKDFNERMLKFSFLNKAPDSVLHKLTAVSSMTELSSIVSSSSLSKLSDAASEDSEKKVVQNKRSSLLIIPSTVDRKGVCKILEAVDDITDTSAFECILANFPQFTGNSKGDAEPMNVLYFFVPNELVRSDEAAVESVANRCQDILSNHAESLRKACVRRVTFSFSRQAEDGFEDLPPVTVTYQSPEFSEVPLIRSIDPSHAIHLDLARMAENFGVRKIGTRHTSTSHIHLYEGTPRPSALAKDKKANKSPRVFLRALSFSLDFSSSSFERILVDALNALDLCPENRKSDNHLFINLVSDFEKAVLDPVVVEQAVVDILKRHGERVSTLGIVEVETKILCSLSRGSAPIALRLVASNPTGYVHVMNTYVEAADELDGDRVFKLIGGTKASLACAGDSSWEGLNVDTPYPLTRPFDHQRKAALRSSDTLYCYDLPALFEAAVEQEWVAASKKGGIEGGIRAASRPLMVMYTTELVVKKIGAKNEDDWTIQDYWNGDLELVQVNRGAGANDVGMVAWVMVLKTVEYPNGRQVVLIANDITHKAGSFGTREDVVFKLASEYAREHRIPRLYVAANSGARIGLADSVKKLFKAAFKDSSKPENGFDFLYLSKADYNSLNAEKQNVIAHPVTYGGEEVYKVTDIIGSESDLGVENLKGSGLIAGETSAAYNDIFTLTIVLGRYVHHFPFCFFSFAQVMVF